jgi:hypothetical protein
VIDFKSLTGLSGVRKWRANEGLSHNFSSSSYPTDIISFNVVPMYKSASFLHQQYVVNQLSIRQIANLCVSSKEAVRSNLHQFKIPLREKSKPHGRQPQLKFGHKRIKGKLDDHCGEQRVIKVVAQMKDEGLSLRAIARCLDEMKIPTKCRGKKWHPEMVKRALVNIKFSTQI